MMMSGPDASTCGSECGRTAAGRINEAVPAGHRQRGEPYREPALAWPESAYDSHNRALTTAFDVATDVGLRRKDLAREDESSEQDRPRNFPVTSCFLSPGPSAISQRVDLSTFRFYARDPLATTDVTVGARSREFRLGHGQCVGRR